MLPPLDLEGLKLNLGSGWDGTDGFIRVDRAGEPDIRLDVSKPLPFADESFIEVRAFHVLEHIERRDLVPLMNECWRVLKTPTHLKASDGNANGGVMEIEVPVFPTEAAMSDPTHVSFFTAQTFDYFTKDGQFDGERLLYGIKPWKLWDRVRDAMAIFLRVRLAKWPDDEPLTYEERRAFDRRNVTAGVGPEGTGFQPGTDDPKSLSEMYWPCCGAPRESDHLGTCENAIRPQGSGELERLQALQAQRVNGDNT